MYKTVDVYVGLRGKILSLHSESPKSNDNSKALAFLMEMGLPDGVVTLVSFGDGGASMYFSTGGGILGAGELPHPDARAASLNLVGAVPTFLSLMRETNETPLPQPEGTRFYAVMPTGLFSAEVKTDDLKNKKHQLWPLFYLGDKLITQIRLIDEAMSKPKQP